MIMDELNKPLEELDLDFIKKKVKAVTFDVDGVIVPTGTFLRESLDGTELIMRMHKLSKEMIEMIKELKSFSKFSVWIFAKKSSDFVQRSEPYEKPLNSAVFFRTEGRTFRGCLNL